MRILNVMYAFQHKVVAYLLVVVATLCAVSLYSYHATDASWFFVGSTAQETLNWCGKFGAYSSALLIYLFGAASWFVVAMLYFVAYLILRNKSFAYEWERLACFAIATVIGAALCRLHNLDFWANPVAGGVFGNLIYGGLHAIFHRIGSAILLYGTFFASLIVVIRFSFVGVVQKGVRLIDALFGKYKIAHKAYAGLKFIVVHGIIRPLITMAYHIKALVDGSAFQESGLLVPHDADEDHDNATYDWQQTQGHVYRMPAQEVEEENDYMIASPSFTLDDFTVEETTIDMTQEPVKNTKPISTLPAVQTYAQKAPVKKNYRLPNLHMFIASDAERQDAAVRKELEMRAQVLEEKLERFGVTGEVVEIKRGPVVTVFEYQPEIDTKLSKILALEDDLAMALQALSIRIIAPIPGRSVVGFEVANKKRENVLFADVVRSTEFTQFDGLLPLVLGKDTVGNDVVVDLVKMPHLLIAGSTGSGKSVALNAMLVSLLCRLKPEELRIILIDPKRLEFASYADIAHLLFPIVTDPRGAGPVLRWVVKDMEERYEKMAACGARNIFDYNKLMASRGIAKLPFIVVIIDELADLMMTTGRETEDLITRIAQMARAAGIHMVVATQRPSVDVITGLIKVNFPSRISFRVTSKIDSRTILDCIGADKLLGRGDMLFLDAGTAELKRVHGTYLSNQEIDDVVSHIRTERPVEYLDLHEQLLQGDENLSEGDDKLLEEVMVFLESTDEVSISLLQRKFRIGYNRSARIIDLLEGRGVILPADGSKTRKVAR